MTDEVSGNVRIVSSPDELSVTLPAAPPRKSLLLGGVLCLYFLIQIVPALSRLISGSGRGNGDLAGLAISCLFLVLFVFGMLRSGFWGREILRCTREDFQIERIDFGKLRKQRSFKTKSAKSMHFGLVRYTESGGGMGLLFEQDGKTVKMLQGLRAVEAKLILDSLKCLGVDVVFDPAMPMMVEMEQSRRKSMFGSIFG